MFCEKCGKEIENGVKFCEFCGASTNERMCRYLTLKDIEEYYYEFN